MSSTVTQNEVSLNQHLSVWEMRSDSWISLNDDISRLIDLPRDSAEFVDRHERITATLAHLTPIESFWAFPGRRLFDEIIAWFNAGDLARMHLAVKRINRMLSNNSYRHTELSLDVDAEMPSVIDTEEELNAQIARPYFEVLIVDDMGKEEEEALHRRVASKRRPDDSFIFNCVIVPTFEDALIAVLFNFNIQAVVIRHGFPFKSRFRLDVLRKFLEGVDESIECRLESERGPLLGARIAELRPELDLFLVTHVKAQEVGAAVGDIFQRVFFREEDHTELYMSIMRCVGERYRTPFFSALKEYSKQPTGVFHALPIARGKSVLNSNWIQDMLQFYGLNLFMAETSATSGGLDSLLEPTGPLKLAQEYAARAFGARRAFFATNGTSTCNKIVVQAMVQPGDIVLLDRNCHKSHHYGMVLGGAHVVYLDSYPLDEYSMYGAVPLADIKRTLLQLRRDGSLARVKMLLLTNCTFDGVVYDVERVMEECLAIKPDLIFLWDEAWFAFARFHPTYRRRTAMASARRLQERYAAPAYAEEYAKHRAAHSPEKWDDEEHLRTTQLKPDPKLACIRVYATQSTHKTLTSLRQGSMILIWDQDFKDKAEAAFHEAYMTHTSTSPNYQILASLDIGRRQVELEGYELVQKQIDLAMSMRLRIATHPLLQKYFRVLTVGDIVPPEYRPSGIEAYYDPETGWANMETAWRGDAFALDPTRLTLAIGNTGIDGDMFKNKHLMDRFGIQINKTSRNTVLFMTNIGTTRSSVAYLLEVLIKIAQDVEEKTADLSMIERRLHEKRIRSLTKDLPPLPDFSRFHPAFRRGGTAALTPEGDIRKAFFMAYDDANCEYLTMAEASRSIEKGGEVVSALFVIPYPPGFPILVPGQVISRDILSFMEALDVKEIHGYRPELGFRVFTKDVLSSSVAVRAAEERAVETVVGSSVEREAVAAK